MKRLIILLLIIVTSSLAFADREFDALQDSLDGKILELELLKANIQKGYAKKIGGQVESLLIENFSLLKLDSTYLANEILDRGRQNREQLSRTSQKISSLKVNLKNNTKNTEDYLFELYSLLGHADYLTRQFSQLEKQKNKLNDVIGQQCNEYHLAEVLNEVDPTKLIYPSRENVRLISSFSSILISYSVGRDKSSGAFGNADRTLELDVSSSSKPWDDQTTEHLATGTVVGCAVVEAVTTFGATAGAVTTICSGVVGSIIATIGKFISWEDDKKLHKKELKILALIKDIYNIQVNSLAVVKKTLPVKAKKICITSSLGKEFLKGESLVRDKINALKLFTEIKKFISVDYPSTLNEHYSYLLEDYFVKLKGNYLSATDEFLKRADKRDLYTENYVQKKIQPKLEKLRALNKGTVATVNITDLLMSDILYLGLINDPFSQSGVCIFNSNQNQINSSWTNFREILCKEIK